MAIYCVSPGSILFEWTANLAMLLLAVWAGSKTTPWLIGRATRNISLVSPAPRLDGRWKVLTAGDDGGPVIGCLERALFYLALWLGGLVAGATIIGGWLTIKVAAKWQMRSHLLSQPNELEGVDPIQYMIARNRWARHVFVSFIVGTLANVLIVVAAVLMASAAAQVCWHE